MIAAISTRILLATLGLLALATSASAECAWVLWATTEVVGKGTSTLAILGAFPSFAECDVKEKGMSNQTADERRAMLRLGVTSQRFQCLPDTVDPRGPKWK